MTWREFSLRFGSERIVQERRWAIRLLLSIAAAALLVIVAAEVVCGWLELAPVDRHWLWTPAGALLALSVAARGPDMRTVVFLGYCAFPIWGALLALAPLAESAWAPLQRLFH